MKNYNLEELQEKASNGVSIADLGKEYGVSRQRIYQVFQRYGLETPVYKRHGFVRTLSTKQAWLWRILKTRGFSGQELIDLVNAIELPDNCPVLGLKLDYEGGQGARKENSPSVDQIIPSGGYTVDNIRVVSWRANRIKMDGTPDEHFMIYKYYSTLGL